MFKCSFPYLKMFCEKGINWHTSLNDELLNRVVEEDKIIFLHIGYVTNIEIRETSLALFSNLEVQKIINENFIPIIFDKEDHPEAFLLALDLLFLNHDYTYGPMNMFIMPDRNPVLAFSDCDKDNFIKIANSLINAKNNNREKLDELSKAFALSTLYSGVVTNVVENVQIDDTLIDKYVESWFNDMYRNGLAYKIKPFTPNPSGLLTLVEYLSHTGNENYLKKTEEILDHLQYSSIFDVVDGGFFRQATDYSCNMPLYEKTLEENSRFMLLYSSAYKLYKKESYRTTANMIFQFIENELKKENGCYCNATTILKKVMDVDYYSYSLNELSLLFSNDYEIVANALGLDLNVDKMVKQVTSRSKETYELLSKEHFRLLRRRRSEHRSYFKDSRATTSSNSSTITALALSATHLNDQDLYSRAIESLEALSKYNVENKRERLYRYSCEEQTPHLVGYLSDYAYFIEASLELYKIEKRKEFLEVALNYLNYVMEKFYKPQNGMFSKSERDSVDEIVPFKRESNLDIVRPSANSIMAGNFLTLYEVTQDSKFLNYAKKLLYNITPYILSSSSFLSSWAHKMHRYNIINKSISSK